MKTVSRRAVLCGISGVGFTGNLVLPAGTAVADDASADKRELFVVGPFNLGDWFDKSKLNIDGLFNLGAPERKDIVKSLSACLAYVIDQRISKDKKVRFADGEDDGPKLVVAGKLHYVWESKEKTFTIQVATPKANASSTNYDGSPPFRSVRVNVGLETTGSTALGNTKSTCYFGPEKLIVYDINGRLK